VSPIAGQGHPGHNTLHTQLTDARDAIAHGNFAHMERYNRLARVHSPLGHGTDPGLHLASDLRPLGQIALDRDYRPAATVIGLWYPPDEIDDAE
jgi:hypothetical protein